MNGGQVGTEAGRGTTIGLDVRKIRDFGIGRYLEGLLGAFAIVPTDERYVLFEADDPESAIPGELREALPRDRFRIVPTPAPLYSVRELLAFRGVAGRYALDLLHFPHYVRALAPGCPVAVTLHDAIHLTHPPSRAARWYARVMMTWSARSAACAFTVSEAARDELSRRLGVPTSHFHVTPNGVDRRFSPPEREVVHRYLATRALTRPFVLCVASHRPHKNLGAAVEGFRRAALSEAELVIPARDRLAATRLEPFASPPRVRILPSVSDAELRLLYAGARVVLCPSGAEGFGLVPLEAAACGGAVLATSIEAHREVLGDAAAYVGRPWDAAAMAHALAGLWENRDAEAALRRAGPPRAAVFTWERTARLTRQGYRTAIGASSPGKL